MKTHPHCQGTRHTENSVVSWQSVSAEWAAEGEEVTGGLLPLSLEAAFGDTLSEGVWVVWNRSCWRGAEDY